jgi:hypothetical protein
MVCMLEDWRQNTLEPCRLDGRLGAVGWFLPTKPPPHSRSKPPPNAALIHVSTPNPNPQQPTLNPTTNPCIFWLCGGKSAVLMVRLPPPL